MSKTTEEIDYDEVINRQQSRISELRKNLAYYNSRLLYLNGRVNETRQCTLKAASVTVPQKTATGISQANSGVPCHVCLYECHAPSPLSQSCKISRKGHPIVPEIEHPQAIGNNDGLKFRQRRNPGKNVKKHLKDTGGSTTGGETEEISCQKTRYWTEREHSLFLYASNLFGPKNYASISQFVQTRTPKQVRTHAQKYRMRLEREKKKNHVVEAKSAVMSSKRMPLEKKNEKKQSTSHNSTVEKPGPREFSKDLSLGSSNHESFNTTEGYSGPDDVPSYDELMKIMAGTSNTSNWRGSQMFGENIELDLDFFDDSVKTRARRS